MDLGKTNYVLSNSRAKSGVPHAVNSLVSKLEKIDSVIESAIKEYRHSLVEDARYLWGDVADTIMVSYDKATMEVTIYSNSDDSFLLEYGTPDTPAAPVLRMAAVEAQQKLVPLIKNRLSKLGLTI